MAQVFVSTEGSLIIPTATASIKVQTANSGLATSGIVILLGEADAGPGYSSETDLNDNAYGPDQVAAIVAKYKSGPLVDAFKATAAPLADPNIPGSPSRIIPVKTNASAKASSPLTKYGGGAYGSLYDKSYGKDGNQIYRSVEAAQSETVPTTGSFTWIPSVGTVDAGFRVNGAALVTANLGAAATPAAVVTAVAALAGVLATGGALRTVLPGASGNLTVTAPGGNVIVISYSSTWTTTPSIGDTLTIATTSPIDGAGDVNTGAYVVTAATTNSVTATKLSDAGLSGAVAGVVTAPVGVGSTAVTATTNFNVYAPVIFTNEAGDPLDGVGKSLEICELTSGADLLSRAAYALSTTLVTWVSKTGSAKLLASGAEYRAKLNLARQSDSASEDFTTGGEIGLKVSYTGTTATLTINDTTLTTTVVGGSGANLSLALKDFTTIADLAAYINAQTGYKAAAGSSALGQFSPTTLDDCTLGICTHFGEYNGRIKLDAYRFFTKLRDESTLVQFGNPAAQAAAGLPQPQATAFLSGGTRGATTAAIVAAAFTALEKVRGNFVVPLFARDATSDVTDGLTDSGSTYQIDAVHALARTHCIAMSKIKRRKNRQAFLSYRGTFADAKDKGAAMAHPRCAMFFQDQKLVGSDGTIQQFQPWVDAAIAAGGQAAAGYKALVRKFKNVSGSLQAAGDFDDSDDAQVEDALLAGLCPTRRHELGGFLYVSDQTTYTRDNNFAYNSIQAVYAMDTIGLTTAQRMEDAIVGQSVADVSRAAAQTFLEAIMADFLRLKLIAASDDAPLGFRNANVRLSGPALIVSVEVKLAGTIYFVPISFLVSQVEQTAQQ